MLDEAGSIASLVGVVVSLLGLGFAIWQLTRLRGETRAARDAAEETRRAVGRDLAIADINRLNDRLQALKEIHRDGDRQRALDLYPHIIELVREIARRHPSLSKSGSDKIRRAISDISEIEATVEGLDVTIDTERTMGFNRTLTNLQSTLLPELEDLLENRKDGMGQ